jgi:hypothetical protein
VRGHFHVPVALSRLRFVGTQSVSVWLSLTAGFDMFLENRAISIFVFFTAGDRLHEFGKSDPQWVSNP